MMVVIMVSSKDDCFDLGVLGGVRVCCMDGLFKGGGLLAQIYMGDLCDVGLVILVFESKTNMVCLFRCFLKDFKFESDYMSEYKRWMKNLNLNNMMMFVFYKNI